jgi:hypothetical protein
VTESHATVRTAREKSGFKAGLRRHGKSGLWRARGSSSASPSEGRIEPDKPRLLLLMIRSARPTLAEVPLADLSFYPYYNLCRPNGALANRTPSEFARRH